MTTRGSDSLPKVPGDPEMVADFVSGSEADASELKSGNAARMHWAGDEKRRTRWSLVYLHGLTASPGECGDAPERLAMALGANAYIPRLPGHGLRTDDALRGIKAEDWISCARSALAVGCAMGERTILVGTSLGASLAFILAARFPEQVAGVAAWSLGARAYDPAELDRLCASEVVLRDPRPRSEAQLRYWSDSMHPDGYRALRALFSDWMTPATAAQVRAPFFLAYYYQDGEHQDKTASVPAMLALYDALGTPSELKRACAYGNGAHVVGSPWRSPAAAQVLSDTIDFFSDGRLATQSSSAP
ncbi:lysophospholipase [Luteimonas sp. TWI1416]|uniref:alpha/beta hydrolase n=1 Tax=unclassified Luteimonas TaxID=2629088 RepID=UPI0032087E6C